LAERGYADVPFKFISSPHIRTLQTAASFQYELTKTEETPILLNPSICVGQTKGKWEKAGGAPYQNGVYAKYGLADVVKMLDSKAKNFVSDTATSHAPKTFE